MRATGQGIRRLGRMLLPRWVLKQAKALYYPRLLRSVRDDAEPEFKVIRGLLRDGDCALDIGANIGMHTAFLARCVGPEGRVFSFEPVPTTFDLLQRSIRALGLRTVTAFNVAASNRDGQTTMSIPEYSDGGENYYQAHIGEERVQGNTRTRAVLVETKRLDAVLLDQVDEIHLIKCDVEGHELPCLSGAWQLIERSKPALMVELWAPPEPAHPDSHELRKRLATLGYETFVYDGEHVVPWTTGSGTVNYLFLTAEHVDTLSTQGLMVG